MDPWPRRIRRAADRRNPGWDRLVPQPDLQLTRWSRASFYRSGDLVRHEVDRNGDGFRDLVLVYSGGELTREEDDRDSDGRPDVITLYHEGQMVQRDEDLDLDGTADVRSFYQNGKLARREVMSLPEASAAEPSSGGATH